MSLLPDGQRDPQDLLRNIRSPEFYHATKHLEELLEEMADFRSFLNDVGIVPPPHQDCTVSMLTFISISLVNDIFLRFSYREGSDAFRDFSVLFKLLAQLQHLFLHLLTQVLAITTTVITTSMIVRMTRWMLMMFLLLPNNFS